jgi:hypothetical protein
MMRNQTNYTTTPTTTTPTTITPTRKNKPLTLLQIALRKLISEKWFARTKNHMENLSKECQDAIIQHALKTILDEIPNLTKSNEIHNEYKEMIGFLDLIKFVKGTDSIKFGEGTLFGGSLRDECRRDDSNIADLDIKFPTVEDLNEFVSELLESGKYSITFLDDKAPIQQTPCRPELSGICPHCKVYVSTTTENKYGASYIKTIVLSDDSNGAFIQMDLTVQPLLSAPKDFDVNTLILRYGELYVEYSNRNYTCILDDKDDQRMKDVLTHIKNKEFLVLTANGLPKLHHDINKSIPIWSHGVEIPRYVCTADCICRHSLKGKRILERIEKMKNKGWTKVNLLCPNPMCILSDDKIYEEYIAEVVEKRQTIAYIKKELKDKARKKWEKENVIKEITRLEKPFINSLNDKERAIIRYGRSERKDNPCHSRITIPTKDYRKKGINKKFIKLDPDDYTLAKEMDYWTNEEEDDEEDEEDEFMTYGHFGLSDNDSDDSFDDVFNYGLTNGATGIDNILVNPTPNISPKSQQYYSMVGEYFRTRGLDVDFDDFIRATNPYLTPI